MNSVEISACEILKTYVNDMFKYQTLESYTDKSVVETISEYISDIQKCYTRVHRSFFDKIRDVFADCGHSNVMVQRKIFLQTLTLLIQQDKDTLSYYGFSGEKFVEKEVEEPYQEFADDEEEEEYDE